MTQPFKFYVLHTTHTDIGYTDNQEKLRAHHVGFLRDALRMADQDPRFVWNAESYWAVQEFLKTASAAERIAFVDAVQRGQLGLSANHFNLTDLVPDFVNHEIMDADRREREALGVQARSALTADINGYGWGWADVLARQGVENLMSSIHTHHGYYPSFRKQSAFWWESPAGERLLSWVGDHYLLGNELGLAQTARFEYTIRDGLVRSGLDPYEISVRRIDAYLQSLRRDSYALPFAPVSVCAYMSDNSPPSLRVVEFCERFNSENRGIVFEAATLDGFFDVLRAANPELPSYRGDWTDWWADGMGSTPADVTTYRAAARSLHVSTKLDPKRTAGDPANFDAAFDHLMMYGEHTWGHSASILEPFHAQVINLDQWKRLYALKAAEAAEIVRGQILRGLGETGPATDRELQLRAVNPHEVAVSELVVFELEHFFGHANFEVIDSDTGESAPFQLGTHYRGPALSVWVELKAGQTRTFHLREVPAGPLPSAGMRAPHGTEGVDDLAWHHAAKVAAGGSVSPWGLENDHFRITFTPTAGITSVFDKASGRELIDPDRPHAAFTPIREVTHPRAGQSQWGVRGHQGRNRKVFRTQRSLGELTDVEVTDDGPVFSRAVLTYRLAGTSHCSVVLTAFKLAPKLDVDLRIHKDSVWDPENVYLALPFVANEFWVEKAGAQLRPRVDQLPGSCVDFYALQSGMVFAGDTSVLVATPDAPLISLGTLAAHQIKLMGEGEPNVDEVYSWVMNNFWETNFKADLGGFHAFHYELALARGVERADAFASLEAMSEGVVSFYRFEGPRAPDATGPEGTTGPAEL